MIIIDTPRKWNLAKNGSHTTWCHMSSDDLHELHKFAELCNIPFCRFENKRKKKRPHYDVRGESEFQRCIENGAKLVTCKEFLIYLNSWYS
jgi:hypothetical protein